MLARVNEIRGYNILETDGTIGHVDQFFFDDKTWTIRYLVVNTGSWLNRHEVLISPIALGIIEPEMKSISVTLTKEQVENSPDIDTQKPVSRQREMEYFSYFGWSYYWEGSGLWGTGSYPKDLAIEANEINKLNSAEERKTGDPHLRSTREVTGYSIKAINGDIGYVEDLIIDDENWSIRYIVVDTGQWWTGKHVLIDPRWIEKVSWTDSSLYTDLTLETIKDCPEFNSSAPLTREYERALYDHYKRSPYWGGVNRGELPEDEERPQAKGESA
jgi:sporulation protein YlmC with PRC-barrel domain